MIVSCVSKNGDYKLCPYRVMSIEEEPVLVGDGKRVYQMFAVCCGEECAAFHDGICLRISAEAKEDAKCD